MDNKTSSLELVRRFWALYQARRWNEARALLSPEAHCLWWATAERFEGAAAVVHVNAVYPEGWTIHLLELNRLESIDESGLHGVMPPTQRVHSLVRVDQDGQSFYANSFFSIKAGRIQAIEEYWADTQAPPAWRSPEVLPGLQFMTTDRRPGVSLELEDPPADSEPQ